ncbi:uncharacterized protein LOC126748714 [Anthonomus grandis grandis]|uniref:uncharacterized protein LOC126748714 n=1 Tax=Anthonomus grandis grandis TaxID=2921223 RepID=UPI002165617D|nr:uncharacterized protein LOC126748714 [Anthonomus grandis grandis]
MPRGRRFDMNAYSLKDQITVFEAVTTLLNNPEFLAQCYPDGGERLMEVRRNLKRAIIAKQNAECPDTRIHLMELTVDHSFPNHGIRCKCSVDLAEELFKTMLQPTEENFINRFVEGPIFGSMFYSMAFIFYIYCIYWIVRWCRFIYGI